MSYQSAGRERRAMRAGKGAGCHFKMIKRPPRCGYRSADQAGTSAAALTPLSGGCAWQGHHCCHFVPPTQGDRGDGKVPSGCLQPGTSGLMAPLVGSFHRSCTDLSRLAPGPAGRGLVVCQGDGGAGCVWDRCSVPLPVPGAGCHGLGAVRLLCLASRPARFIFQSGVRQLP